MKVRGLEGRYQTNSLLGWKARECDLGERQFSLEVQQPSEHPKLLLSFHARAYMLVPRNERPNGKCIPHQVLGAFVLTARLQFLKLHAMCTQAVVTVLL